MLQPHGGGAGPPALPAFTPPARPQGTRGEAVDVKERGKGSWGGWGSKNWALLEKWSEISRGEREKTGGGHRDKLFSNTQVYELPAKLLP